MRRFGIAAVAVLVAGAIGTAVPAQPVHAALIPTTTTLAVPSSPAPAFVGTTLVATVSPAPSNYTHVMFWAGSEIIASAMLDDDGRATYTRGWGFAPGTVTFRATYGGDSVHGASESAPQQVTFEDMRRPVSVSLGVDPSTATLRGDDVTFTVGVSPKPDGGTIDIYQFPGNTIRTNLTLGPNGTVNATATLTGIATYQFQACFSGTEAFADACSVVVPHETYQVATTTTLAIEPATVYPNQPFTLRASISPVPSEEAYVTVGSSPFDMRTTIPIDPVTGEGAIQLVSSNYTWGIGTHELRAYFPGTMRSAPSNSDTVRLTIARDPVTFDAFVTQGAAVGDPITLSASVSPAPSEPSAGVSFRIMGPAASGFGESRGFVLDGQSSGAVDVDTDGWPAGDYWYDATFGGDPELEQATVRGFFELTDIDAPTGAIEVAPAVDTVITTKVMVDVAATDGVGSGVTTVALSNDGTTWSERAYAPSMTWDLAGGDGTKTVWARWRDQAGNWSSISQDSVQLNAALATVSPISVRYSAGTALSSGTLPLRVSWTAAGLTTLAGYRVERSTDGGSWQLVNGSVAAGSLVVPVSSGHAYRFRVRATDKAGSAGPWSTTREFAVRGYQDTSSRITYSASWTRIATTAAWGGYLHRSGTKGASARISLTGTGAAWVSRTGPTRGSATVWVNGVKVATVSLYSATWQTRKVVWSAKWSSSATRRIEVRVVGTADRPRVEVDGFLNLQ